MQKKEEPKGGGRRKMKMQWAHNNQQTNLSYMFIHLPNL
jgi:hypothetical protein